MFSKDILGYKSLNFNTKRKKILANRDIIKIEDIGEEINFQKMISYRIPMNPSLMYKQLNSKEGFVASHVGVSASIDVEFENSKKNYLLTCTYGNKDGKILAKLISGYHPLGKSFNQAIAEETKEEILVVDEKDNIQRGHFSAFGLESSLPTDNLKKEYSNSFPYSITSGGSLDFLHSLDKRKIEGIDKVKLLFASFVSSGQMVFPLKLFLPKKGSLYHLEDVFNPEKQKLDIKLNRRGILLLEKDKKGFSGNTFHFINGNFIPGPKPEEILLYSAFIPKDNLGIVNDEHILFKEYLAVN